MNPYFYMTIFLYDYVIRKKKWISKDKRPIITVTGSHNKTIVFGCLSRDGKQLFKQYARFDSSIFVDFLKHLQTKFGNLRNTISEYYRTRRFNLDITKYLLRSTK